MRLNPDQAKPPRSANTRREARDLLRDLITNGLTARRRRRGLSRRRKSEGDGGQRERFDRDGERTPTGGSSKRRRGGRARSARASRRADRRRGGRTRDSPASPYRHRRPFGRRGNPEPSATASPAAVSSKPFCARVEAKAGPLGRPRLPSSYRGRRPCAVVGLRGRTPDCLDPKRAKLGDGCRPRRRRADRDQQGSTASSRR